MQVISVWNAQVLKKRCYLGGEGLCVDRPLVEHGHNSRRHLWGVTVVLTASVTAVLNAVVTALTSVVTVVTCAVSAHRQVFCNGQASVCGGERALSWG